MDPEEIMITMLVAVLVAGAILVASRGSTASQPAAPSQAAAATKSKSKSKSSNSGFRAIADNYTTIGQVSAGLRKAGLESSELIVGIDFTKSNEWTGEKCFNGKSLHFLDPKTPNPYQVAIQTVANTLEAFDDDGLIPAYGFGCANTKDRKVFSLTGDDSPCNGFSAVLDAYTLVAPTLKLSGPTSFAPLIRKAIDIVRADGGFHVLMIVADGQVTSERETIEAIVEASKYPLAIVLVGVGDGPWEMMREFDDQLPDRAFDNFQFVPYEETKASCTPEQFEAKLALGCLMEIPEQFQSCRDLGLFSECARPPVTSAAPPEGGDEKAAFSKGFSKGATAQDPSNSDPPENYLCPVTHEVMSDPVVCTDGYTYEREAIEGWFRNKNTSPMNNQKVDPLLIPNNSLRSQIMEWKEHN